MDRANKAGHFTHKTWGLQLVYGFSMNTDKDILDKRTLSECPVASEIGWDGRKTMSRHVTDIDDCECFVDEFDVAEDTDTFWMTFFKMTEETLTSSAIGGSTLSKHGGEVTVSQNMDICLYLWARPYIMIWAIAYI